MKKENYSNKKEIKCIAVRSTTILWQGIFTIGVLPHGNVNGMTSVLSFATAKC